MLRKYANKFENWKFSNWKIRKSTKIPLNFKEDSGIFSKYMYHFFNESVKRFKLRSIYKNVNVEHVRVSG